MYFSYASYKDMKINYNQAIILGPEGIIKLIDDLLVYVETLEELFKCLGIDQGVINQLNDAL